MYPELNRFPYFAIDSETTGLLFWRDKIFGFSISTPDGSDYYWDIREHPKALEWLSDSVRNYNGMVIGHNVKFDVHFFRETGVDLMSSNLDDTMIRAALIDEHLMSYGLDHLGTKYIGTGKTVGIYQELANIFGGKPTKNVQMANLWRAPSSLVGKYAKQDTRVTLDLWEWQQNEIERQQLHKVCELERKLLPVMIDVERGGVTVDVDGAERAVQEITKKAKFEQYQLDSMAGFPINPNPSNSIKDLFKPKQDKDGNWVLIDGTVAPPTEAGKACIDASVLRSMKHPAAAMILNLRKLLKTRDTFLRGHILGHHDNGIIHANFNQTKTENDVGTGTGRLSVNAPALQQIHKRDKDIAGIVRALFIPDYGQDWVCNDWAQMDSRVMAHYVNDPTIIKMYNDNPDIDFHQLVADMTGLPRSARFSGDANAKQINLGLTFGMGQGTLAEEMGLPLTVEKVYIGKGCPDCDEKTCRIPSHIKIYKKPGSEAISIFDQYHSAIPGIQDMLKSASSVARSRGYVMTMAGRHIRFPRGMFVHKAGGLIFQGTAADALKVKLIEVHDYLKSMDCGARLMLSVHDEYDCSVPKGRDDIKRELNRILTDFSTGPIRFRVPIRTSQGTGPDWWEASK